MKGTETMQQKELAKLRGKFWHHLHLRHPGDVPSDWKASTRRHPTDDAELRVVESLYGGGCVYLVRTNLSDRRRPRLVARYLKPLKTALAGESVSVWGGTFREGSICDEHQWDEMADWLHGRRVLYQRVIAEVVGEGK